MHLNQRRICTPTWGCWASYAVSDLASPLKRVKIGCMNEKPHSVISLPRFRFGLTALLSVTSCVACYVVGRKHGFDEASSLLAGAPPVTRVYDVHLIINRSKTGEAPPSVEDVVAQIQTEIERAGSFGTVSVLGNPTAGVLQISTRELAHGRIRRLLTRWLDASP